MNPRVFYILPILWSASAWADSVTLKTGEVLQGKILREMPEAVVIEYQFSATIRDERSVLRSEIAKVEREQADAKLFEEIQKISLPVTALDVSVYDEIIGSKLQPFLKAYPYSPNCAAVRVKIADFEAEKKRLSNGQLKLEGGWISDLRIEEEKYQLDARRTYEVQKLQYQKGNLIGALNQFGKIETNWPNASVYPEAVESAKVALEKMDQVLTHELRNFPILQEHRRVTLERTPPEYRQQVEVAQKAETDSAVAALAGVKKDLKYPPYSTLVRESMDGLQKTVQVERVRLNTLNLKPFKTAVAESQQAAALIEQNQLALADTALKNAEAAWPNMEILPRLQKRLEEARQAVNAGNEAQSKAVKDAADLQNLEAKPTQP